MNKKIIIGLVIAGVVIVGGVYLYNQKKAKDIKNNLATESDAIAFLDADAKRGNKKLNVSQTKDFIKFYTANIDKPLHSRLIAILGKKESEFDTKDKLDLSILKEKVIEPLKKNDTTKDIMAMSEEIVFGKKGVYA